VAPAAQLTEAEEVDTADGPLVAACCPGRVSSGPEDARESVDAWQPPLVTVHSPSPVEVFARPPSTAASDPVASECTFPEHVAVEPAGQLSEPEASEVDSRPPVTVGFPPAVAARATGWVKVVAELDWDPQVPPVVEQSEEPVDVFAFAVGPAVDTAPVVGSASTSPAPVEEVFAEPVPEQPF
jgi:hypothetical protein